MSASQPFPRFRGNFCINGKFPENRSTTGKSSLPPGHDQDRSQRTLAMKLAQELSLHDINQQDGEDKQGHDGADVEESV